MKAINRLFEYFEYKGIKPTRFEKENGLSNGYFSATLKRGGDLGSGIVEIIINNCQDLNIEWLVAGSGSMIKEQCNDPRNGNSLYNAPGRTGPPLIPDQRDEIIAILKEQIELQKDYIELLKSGGSFEDGQKRKAN